MGAYWSDNRIGEKLTVTVSTLYKLKSTYALSPLWSSIFLINIENIIIVIIYSLMFFTSALADGLSLEFLEQQVSSSLQDSFQHSGCSQ